MKKIQCSIALVITVFLFASFVSYASSDGAVATITKVKGAPRIIKSATTDELLLKIGETVGYGDTIITDSDSKATLVFNDGEIRIITSGSNVKFNAGEPDERLTKVAKITSTLAEAVNAQNLDNTFLSVTGAKLSMSGGAEKKKASGAAFDMESKIAGEESSKSLSDGWSNSSGGKAGSDIPSGDRVELPGSFSEADVPIYEKPASIPAPVLSSAPRATSEKKPAETPCAQWGYWFDDSDSLPWDQLMSKEVFNNLEKISFHSAAITQLGAGNFTDKLSLTGINDNITKVTVSFRAKKGDVDKSFRSQLTIDNKHKNKTAGELKKIERLKDEDIETYLYLKAGIFKQNRFYIAALAALYELEKLHPGVIMPHVLKSKAVIYFNMGEKELSKAASDKLLK